MSKATRGASEYVCVCVCGGEVKRGEEEGENKNGGIIRIPSDIQIWFAKE